MSKNSTYLRVAKRNKKSNDRQGKVTNKIWETTFFGGYFRRRGANPLTLTLTVQNSATPPLREKGWKRKFIFIYIYKYKNILLTFLYFSVASQEERRGVRKIGLSVSVSAKRHIKSEVVRNYDFGRRKLNLCAPKAMDFRRVNLLNAFLLKIASLRTPKFGGFKK